MSTAYRTHYINELNLSLSGSTVTVAGWVHEVRDIGKIVFLLLRDRTGIVQVTAKKGEASESLIKKMKLPKESVVQVKGIIKANKEVKAGFEIEPREIINLNPLSTKIPFDVTGKVPANLDVRLNYRYIDLRRRETQAIFNIESTVLNAFSSYLYSQGFQQIRTPCIIAEASEGGSEPFPVVYFEKAAFLAQSPQLYKQMAVIGGMDKVFMIMPIFRAEKSNTVYHLTESTQMDVEIGFANAADAIEVLCNTVTAIIKRVIEKNKTDLEVLGAKLEIPEIKKITYLDAIKKLSERGYPVKYGDDLTRKHEKALQAIFGDAIVVRDYPTKLRAFYSMPKKDNPELSESFDFIYKGLEISSGAQRIHQPDLLIEALKKRGLNPNDFESYINAFKCGAPPHAGWSIGLERFTMQLTGAKNIRECALFPRDRDRITP
ncbi:MAG: aspartate--tRNA(Asn) ligase [Candidatus Micrarchaeales archaeon]